MNKLKKYHLIILLTIGSIPASFSQYNLNGYWQDNLGMHYYVRHVGNTIYWFGERNDGLWAGAFKGTITNNTRNDISARRTTSIIGSVYDLPKGKASMLADLGLTVVSANEMRKVTGPFSATVFRKKLKPRNFPGIRSAGYTKEGITGMWNCNDGGTYYMRQIGNKVIWFGEKYNGGNIDFSNVAFGTKTGNLIHVDWADVPKGRTLGRGSLILRMDGNIITKTSGSGFNGSRWTKSNKKEIDKRVFDVLIQGHTHKISVHLNNYVSGGGGSPRWYKGNDAYVNLPEAWGSRFNLNLPEINKVRRFRNYHYYVNDINSSAYGVSGELKTNSTLLFETTNRPSKQPIIELSIRLETDGTEIVGRCTSCPSSDKGAPDVHISKKNKNFPVIYVYIPLIIKDGNISYDNISTYFDANIQAGGICKIVGDLCNKITNYRETIRTEINRGFQSSFNSATVKRNFENSLNQALPSEIRGKITKLVMEDNNIIIEYN